MNFRSLLADGRGVLRFSGRSRAGEGRGGVG